VILLGVIGMRSDDECCEPVEFRLGRLTKEMLIDHFRFEEEGKGTRNASHSWNVL
jgi:hypothetical protein